MEYGLNIFVNLDPDGKLKVIWVLRTYGYPGPDQDIFYIEKKIYSFYENLELDYGTYIRW